MAISRVEQRERRQVASHLRTLNAHQLGYRLQTTINFVHRAEGELDRQDTEQNRSRVYSGRVLIMLCIAEFARRGVYFT